MALIYLVHYGPVLRYETIFSAAVPTLVESDVRLPAPAEPGGLAERPYILLFLFALRILILGFYESTFSNLSVVDLKK